MAAGSPVAAQSLRTVIRENVDGMLVIDREGVVVFANPAAERLLGRAAQALERHSARRSASLQAKIERDRRRRRA